MLFIKQYNMIDGRHTTDMDYWVVFAAERLDDVIRNIPVVKGLELSGVLSDADCSCIISKEETLEFLDLSQAIVPAHITPDNLPVIFRIFDESQRMLAKDSKRPKNAWSTAANTLSLHPAS